MTPLELIKNGLLQSDLELVRQGYFLMTGDTLAQSTVSVNVPAEGKHYQCQNCGHELFSDITRKRCPQCKKHQLQLVDKTVATAIEIPESQPIAQEIIPTPESESPIHTFTQAPPAVSNEQQQSQFAGQAQAGGNTWVDDGTECVEDKTMTDERGKYFLIEGGRKVYLATPVARGTREAPQPVTAECNICKAKFTISSALVTTYMVCDSCGVKPRR
jgi:Zn finger protein HypA/HybF involved in hydrogenase expression